MFVLVVFWICSWTATATTAASIAIPCFLPRSDIVTWRRRRTNPVMMQQEKGGNGRLLLKGLSPSSRARQNYCHNTFDPGAENDSRLQSIDPPNALSSTVRDLQQVHGQDSILLISTIELNDTEYTYQAINSLVFQLQPSGHTMLVILPDQYQVDSVKLLNTILRDGRNNSDIQTTTSVSLAPSEQLLQLCGYIPGTVPPVGLSPSPVITIFDSSLIQNHHQQGVEGNRVIGGGGHLDWRCVVSVEMLLQQPNVQVADIRKAVVDQTETIVPNVNGAPRNTRMDRIYTKPFFPLSPPPLYWAEKVLQTPDMVNPLQNELITVVGRITGIRRMAKQLVFCDLGPPSAYRGTSSTSMPHKKEEIDDDDDDDDHPWRSGLDGQEMAIQLIAGKTLCQQKEGPSALRKLKPGLLVLVNARTNVQSRESLVNWIKKRSLDLVILSYQILDEPAGESNNNTLMTLKESQEDQQTREKDRIRAIQRRSKEVVEDIHARTPPSNFTRLRLVDVLAKPKNSKNVILVDDLESIHHFSSCLTHLLLSLTTMNEADTSTSSTGATPRFGWFGIDCEWKPSFYSDHPNDDQPVLLLQVCMSPRNCVFLFDLQRLLRPLCAPTETMTTLELALSEAFTDLWLSTRLPKCGFQLMADLRRLAASYPHIPAFQQVNAVVEVSSLAKRVLHMNGQRNSRYWTSSLARVTEYFLKKTLNKEQQVCVNWKEQNVYCTSRPSFTLLTHAFSSLVSCNLVFGSSDWSRRPLTKEQMEYAALDAAISPALVKRALQKIQAAIVCDEKSETFAPRLSRWQGDDALASCINSCRFMFLDSEDPIAIRKLRAKKIVGNRLVMTQSWITGRVAPNSPTTPVNDAPFIDVNGATRMPTRAVSIRNPITKSILCNIIGKSIAKSKERCLQTILRGIDALPQGSSLEFPQRSGYVEFKDGVALFVNMPDKHSQSRPQTYPNVWLDNGRILTWYLREHEWGRGESKLAKKLQCSSTLKGQQNVAAEESLVVLFVRSGKDPYLCCGLCAVIVPDATESLTTTAAPGVTDTMIINGWDLMQLNLHLLDSNSLSESDAFQRMVGL